MKQSSFTRCAAVVGVLLSDSLVSAVRLAPRSYNNGTVYANTTSFLTTTSSRSTTISTTDSTSTGSSSSSLSSTLQSSTSSNTTTLDLSTSQPSTYSDPATSEASTLQSSRTGYVTITESSTTVSSSTSEITASEPTATDVYLPSNTSFPISSTTATDVYLPSNSTSPVSSTTATDIYSPGNSTSLVSSTITSAYDLNGTSTFSSTTTNLYISNTTSSTPSTTASIYTSNTTSSIPTTTLYSNSLNDTVPVGSPSSFFNVGNTTTQGPTGTVGTITYQPSRSSSLFYSAGNSTGIYGPSVTGTGFSNHTTSAWWPNATDADQCWDQWTTYWDGIESGTTNVTQVSYVTAGLTSWTSTYTYIIPAINATTLTNTASGTQTVTEMNGDFTKTIYTTAWISTVTSTVSARPGTTEPSTWTVTTVAYSASTSVWTPYTGPSPSCVLPNSFSKCEDEWEDWAASAAVTPPPIPAKCDYTAFPPMPPYPDCATSYWIESRSWDSYYGSVYRAKPDCTQAIITGAQCDALRDEYVEGNVFLVPSSIAYPGLQLSNGYWKFPYQTAWTWPGDAQFAPGCTLGCGRCAVTGGTIELLYFPPGLSHPATGGPLIVTTLGTEFTSPSYYISFHSVYASDACKGVGPTITSTIVALPTDVPLSSLWASPVVCIPNNINGKGSVYITATASFNVSDLLQSSVPYSIYSSQPSCASWSGYQPDGLCGFNKTCPTTDPYRPIVVVPNSVLAAINPAWADCSADLRGLYDPPIALTPTDVAAGPTVTGGVTTTTDDPTPGPTPGPTGGVTTTPRITTALPVVTTTTVAPANPSPGDSGDGGDGDDGNNGGGGDGGDDGGNDGSDDGSDGENDGSDDGGSNGGSGGGDSGSGGDSGGDNSGSGGDNSGSGGGDSGSGGDSGGDNSGSGGDNSGSGGDDSGSGGDSGGDNSGSGGGDSGSGGDSGGDNSGSG
ncbi:hypothetical protein K431DRAFT_313768, partial [Polychaeton citri CBS 116435]